MSGADLFVVCKNCQSEVSAYITECPYCGARLRKRAPKLDRPERQRERRARAPRRSSLGRLRPGEIPGIRVDRRPYATLALVAAAVGMGLAWQVGLLDPARVWVTGGLGGEWWRALTAPFVYLNTGYMLIALLAVALFGWLLERRHGPWAPLLVFLAGGGGGMLLASVVEADAVAFGGNGGGLALLAAWAVPDLRARRAGEETESDLLGAGVIAAALLLVSLAVEGADAVAGAGGAVIGLALGAPLAALSRER